MVNLKRMTSREINLRYANPWKTILVFCLPTVIMLIIMSLYNLADKLLALTFSVNVESHRQSLIDMYNHFQNTSVTSIDPQIMHQYINVATQYATQTYSLFFACCVVIAMGAAMMFSIAYGKRDFAKAREIVGNGFSLSLIFSVIISFVIVCITYPGWNAVFVTSQMGSDYNPITEQLSWEYMVPLIAGAPLFFASTFWARILASEGRINLVVWLTIGGIIVACAFSILFMVVGHLGLYGPMLGTLVSWMVQMAMSMLVAFLSKTSYSSFSWQDFYKIRWSNIASFAKAGFPNFVINVAFMISGYVATMLVVMLPNQIPTPVNNHGVSIFQQLLSSYLPWNTMILSAGIGLMQGTRSIIAYNYGAQKYARIWTILKKTSVLMFAWFTLVFLLILGCANYMLATFYFPKEWIAHYRWYLVLMLMSLPLVSLTYIALELFQGINWSLISTWTSSLRSITVNIPMMLIGWGVAKATGQPIWFFVFMGLVDVVSSFLIIPLFTHYWKKYKSKIKDIPDNDLTTLCYWYTMASSIKTVSPEVLDKFARKYNNYIKNEKYQEYQ